MDADLEQLISLIFATTRKIRAQNDSGEKMSINSYLRIGTLIYICENKDPTMKSLADYLNITPPSVTSLVNGLVKSMQIKRIADKKDKRIARLVITPNGKKTLENGLNKKREKLKEILSRLDNLERKNLINILNKLLKYDGKI